jgi:septal ring factor EnvC (AmiA/AmiB activator)
MKKETKSFSLSPRNKAFLDKQDNASAIVDDLVDEYRKGNSARVANLEVQIKHKKEELENVNREKERLENNIAELRMMKDNASRKEVRGIEEARDALEETPKKETNEAIKNWSKRLGMTEAELIETL